jgi:hypothetical protein
MKIILPKDLITQITNVRSELEKIANLNEVTDLTASWLYNLCECLSELEN